MKVLIADDEPLARSRLRELLAEIGGYQIVGEAVNGKDALQQGVQVQPDLILMDIRMPTMDGLEAAMHLSALEQPPAIIFTTAFGDHALQAFEAHAVDYLLKPIRKERLEGALHKLQQLNRAQLSALNQTKGETHDSRARTHVSVLNRGNLQLVPVADIRYFKADQKYVTVRFATGEVLIEESLKDLEEEFSERFFRIHRNALAASGYVSGLVKDHEGDWLLTLQGVEEQLEISRRHLPEVRKRLTKS
ncbi:MAG: LytTR family DNA-binding domain-containing protein [Gammaproteobacteria bacterium]